MFIINYLIGKKQNDEEPDFKRKGTNPITKNIATYEQKFDQISKNKKFIEKQELISLFENCQDFANNLFDIFQKNQIQIDKKLYVELCEYFSQIEYTTQFSHLNCIQFFVQIILGQKEFDKFEQIDFNQAKTVIKNIFNLITPLEDQTIKAILKYNYDSESDKMSLDRFIFSLNQQFIHLNSYLQLNIYNQLKKTKSSFKLPQYCNSTDILNDQLLTLLYFSNVSLRNENKIDLLYSFRHSGTSFNRVTFALDGYDGSTIILIKHKDKETNKEFIFGAYRNSKWVQDLAYDGDSQCYLFSLSPQFRKYLVKKNNATDFCYFNSKQIDRSVYKVGLGFGGKSFKDFRLWIDDDIETQSYITNEDQTYDDGFLADFHTKKLNIIGLEIWGLGGDNALNKREEFREYQRIEQEKCRKVNKKEFMNDFDQGVLLEKTFGHRAQIQDRDGS